MVPLKRITEISIRFPRVSLPAHYRDAVSFALLAVLFGGAFVAIKTGLREFPPLLFASFRFDIGAVVLIGYVVATRTRSAWLPETRRDVLGILVAGVFLVALNNALLFSGQGSTTPAMASIMYGLNPVLAPIFAWWLLGDRLSKTGALGIGIALAGVVTIVQPSPESLTGGETAGQFLVLGAATAIAVGSVLLKRIHPQMDRLPLTAWAMGVGALCLHLVSVANGEPQVSPGAVSPLSLASLLLVGVPSTAVAYALHFVLLERIGPVRANLVAYVVPITAALTGWLLLGAGLSAVTIVGFVVVVLGFGLVERQTLRGEVCRLRRWRGRRRGTRPVQDDVQRWPCDD